MILDCLFNCPCAEPCIGSIHMQLSPVPFLSVAFSFPAERCLAGALPSLSLAITARSPLLRAVLGRSFMVHASYTRTASAEGMLLQVIVEPPCPERC